MRLVCSAALVAALGCSGKGATGPEASDPITAAFPLAALEGRALCDALGARSARVGSVHRDPEPRIRRKVVISDLHLGPGVAAGRRFDGIEDFFFAAELSRYLARLSASGPTDLIIAGDFIEFWQILGALDQLPERDSPLQPPGGALLGADQAAAVAALDIAVAAHSDVFRALGSFAGGGDNRLVVLAGNHDAELAWPRVRLQLVRALGVRDPKRVLFADAPGYRHGGVHVEHGHRFDGANALTEPMAPVALDGRGTCRLQSSWGQVFVARFFNRVERRYPFVDNLYPESAALYWGLRDDPDKLFALRAAGAFARVLASAESTPFNMAALRAALLNLVGAPSPVAAVPDATLGAEIWEALPESERYWQVLLQLMGDPKLAGVRDTLVAAGAELPDIGAALAKLMTIDFDRLGALVETLISDPMERAAASVLAQAPDVGAVVFGHTHLPGGAVVEVASGSRRGHYANTGAWIPVQEVSALRAAHPRWTDLSIGDRAQFPARFPAVVIEYAGAVPSAPRLDHVQ